MGSLYDGGPMLIEPMREAIHQDRPGARLVRLTDSAGDRRGAAGDGAGRATGARPAEKLIESAAVLRSGRPPTQCGKSP